MNDEVEVTLKAANDWIETATFNDATDEQVRTLMDAFELRAAAAGREPLTNLEVEALVDLQHGLTAKRAFIHGILTGEIKVAGQRENGEFLYSAPQR